MKTMKLIYPLALALIVTLASTGCKHKPEKTTIIPGSKSGVVGDNGGGTLPPGETITPGEGITKNPSGITGADPSSFENMTEDRAALAAYTIHFAFDSSAIKSSEQSNLEAVAAALKADPNTKLKIEGNCDDRGTEEYNRSLGERRALAAREALAKDGIDPARVLTISFGKDRPADPAHDEAAWAKNRRDEFVLLHPKGGI